MSEFTTQNLANMAWAFAMVKRPDAKLIKALARAADRQVSEFKPQGLEMTLWALS